MEAYLFHSYWRLIVFLELIDGSWVVTKSFLTADEQKGNSGAEVQDFANPLKRTILVNSKVEKWFNYPFKYII